jgi:predicted transcriptional regulator
MLSAKISRTYIKRSSRHIHDYNGVYKEGKYKDFGRTYYLYDGVISELGSLTTNWRYICHILSPLLKL